MRIEAASLSGRVTFVTGARKACGKTAFLRYALGLLREVGESPAFLSIGFEGAESSAGEGGLSKNAAGIPCLPGELFVTSRDRVASSECLPEIAAVLPGSSALGKLAVVRARRPGRASLVGPESNAAAAEAIRIMREELGARSVLVDGAMNRITQVSAFSGARFVFVLRAGAGEFDAAARAARRMALLASLPALGPLARSDAGAAAAAAALPAPAAFLEGPLTAATLARVSRGIATLVVEDFTKVFLSEGEIAALSRSVALAVAEGIEFGGFVVSLRDIPRESFARALADPRIEALVAYDPYRGEFEGGALAESRAEFASAWEFSRFEELWKLFLPLTPYGKEAKEERGILVDRDRLEEIYDGTEAALGLLSSLDGPSIDRLAYHLRRLCRLPFEEGAPPSALDLVGLFLVKKFIANYRGALSLVDGPTRSRFGLAFESEALAAELDLGGSDPETFFVSERYDPALPETRAAIARVDDALRDARKAAREASRAERGLDFGSRDFVVLPHAEAAGLLAPLPGAACAFAVEAYDGSSCSVRILRNEAELLLEEERDSLLARERSIETVVVERLGSLVAGEAERLLGYARAIREFDLARARAVLARDLGLRRPELRPAPEPQSMPEPQSAPDSAGKGPPELVVEEGRFLPCESDCAGRGVAYLPLGARLSESAALIFGSNMGGKTIVLKTIAFLQLAAQAGFFVPAGRFATSVYDSVACLGEGLGFRGEGGQGFRGEAGEGLSGFGFEIRAFAAAWDRARRGPCLVLMDEFARTTGSREAEAIISAVLGAFAGQDRARCLIATHFRGVARMPGVAYLKMRGLDREAALSAMGAEESLADRIRRINGMMRYELLGDAEAEEGGSDALAVARLLGLDATIASDAERRWREGR